jgi:flagellar assembly factor FliW
LELSGGYDMQLETSRFGQIEVEPNSIITFTQPILGFQEYRRFVLLPGPGESLTWLQSTDSTDLAFILLDPRSVVSDYQIEVRPSELTELAVSSVDELDVYTLVVVPDDPTQVRTNLKAPILISMKHRLGRQTLLDRSNYPIQFFLAQAQPGNGNPQEASNARSNA